MQLFPKNAFPVEFWFPKMAIFALFPTPKKRRNEGLVKRS